MPLFNLPPRPWTHLPTPPSDPSQHLAFWQQVGRALDLGGATLQEVEDEATLHNRPPLVQAAEELNAPIVATLLDDPAVRAWLVEQSQPKAWLPRAEDQDPVEARDDDDLPDQPLAAALYRPLERERSNNPADEAGLEAWEQEAPLAQEAIVAMLLAAGAVPNPIAWLAMGYPGNPSIVDRMMAAGHAPMRIDHPHAQALGVATTALHLAALSARPTAPGAVERLLAHGWAIDETNHEGRTALYEALARPRPGRHEAVAMHGIVNRLLEAGAATEWPEDGTHAMIVAARHNNEAGVDTLLNHGFTHLLHRPSEHGHTPLNHALDAGHPAMALHLLDRGAEPDAHSLSLARIARERVGSGGMFPLPTFERERWERLLVTLESLALRHDLIEGPAPSACPQPRKRL